MEYERDTRLSLKSICDTTSSTASIARFGWRGYLWTGYRDSPHNELHSHLRGLVAPC